MIVNVLFEYIYVKLINTPTLCYTYRNFTYIKYQHRNEKSLQSFSALMNWFNYMFMTLFIENEITKVQKALVWIHNIAYQRKKRNPRNRKVLRILKVEAKVSNYYNFPLTI